MRTGRGRRPLEVTCLAVALLLPLLVAAGQGARASGGALDPTFGTDGNVVTDFGLTNSPSPVGRSQIVSDDFALATIVHEDGDRRIITAGSSAGRFAVARYTDAGQLDGSFDGDGKVVTDLPGTSETATALAIQPHGQDETADKIVVAGIANSQVALARYGMDGALDESFGTAGTLILTSPLEGTTDMVVQPDGKIVLVGPASSTFSQSEFGVIRLLPDGRALDPSFGPGGTVITDFGAEDKPEAVTLQTVDGDVMIVVGGRGDNNFALARYDPEGRPDGTFNPCRAPPDLPDGPCGGKVVTSLGGSGISDITIQPLPEGSAIVAAGVSGSSHSDFTVVRYLWDGSLDTSFDDDGMATTDFATTDDFASAVALQPVQVDGETLHKIVVAGRSASQHALARYEPDGEPDSGFGGGGRVVTAFDSTASRAEDIAVQSDGKLVVAGHTYASDVNNSPVCPSDPHPTGCDLALARYSADPLPVTDVTLEVSDSGLVSEGTRLTYTATVANAGPAAVAVQLLDEPLPSGVLYESANATQGTCRGRIRCDLGILAPGASATVAITVVPVRAAAGDVVNTLTVAGPFDDQDPSNNSRTTTTTVIRGTGGWATVADLAQERSDHTATVLGGPACEPTSPESYCGKVLVVGGRSGQQVPLNSVELFDPAETSWKSCPPGSPPSSACPGPLRHARFHHTAILLTGPRCSPHCGKVLVSGGAGEDLEPFVRQSAELYDPMTGTWSDTGSMKAPHLRHGATILTAPGCATRCGLVLAAGTSVEDGEERDNRAELYDPGAPDLEHPGRRGAWFQTGGFTGDPPTRTGPGVVLLSSPACEKGSAADWCGKVLAVAGNNGCSSHPECGGFKNNHRSSELYDPATGKWSTCQETEATSTCPGPLRGAPRRFHTTTLIAGTRCGPSCGEPLVVGGSEDESHLGATNDTELYDPSSGRWRAATPLILPRSQHTATSLSDGRVLVAGGGCCKNEPPLPISLLFDATVGGSGHWSGAATMNQAREDHTATVLTGPHCADKCGKVLVVGGFDGTSRLSSTELYTPPPMITEVTPAAGPARGGTSVTIRGVGLGNATTVHFGTAVVPAEKLRDGSNDRLVVESPPAALVGPVDVIVETPLGTSLSSTAARFVYTGIPGRPELGAVALSETDVELTFRAVGADGLTPPPIGSYIIRESVEPIDDRNAGGAEILCTCEFEPAGVGDVLTQTVTHRAPGTTYHYTVLAVGRDGALGPLSNSVAVTTPGTAPTTGLRRGLPPGNGYWLVAGDGGVFAFGKARFLGSTGTIRLNQAISGMASTPSGNGYWLVARDGGVFAFGDARFFGSTGAIRLNQPVVGMASTPSGNGYWLVAGDGGVFAFGDARFFGSTAAIRLNQPIVGIDAVASGRGYRLVGADGGVFAFGDDRFFGSTAAIRLNQAMVGTAGTPSGNGYWVVARDGGVFAFGDARFFGSTGAIRLNQPVAGMASAAGGLGYRLVGADGGVFAFGAAPFLGSTAALRLNEPIVAMAAVGR